MLFVNVCRKYRIRVEIIVTKVERKFIKRVDTDENVCYNILAF